MDAVVLGVVQGLTEFIPVSSSGHLIIARGAMGMDTTGLAFDAVLQLATAFAVLIYFKKDFFSLVRAIYNWVKGRAMDLTEKSLILALILGTVPAVVAGVILEDYMETVFRSVHLVAGALLFGSILMAIAEYLVKKRVYEEELSPIKGFVIGLFQCLALIPGISRSGATISGGLFAGLSREGAAKFSFFLSIPILLGSGFKKLWDIVEGNETIASPWLTLLPASIVSFAVGMFAIHFLLKYLRKNSLHLFIWYRVVLAIALLVWFV